MNKHQYLKEYRLVNYKQIQSPYTYLKPTNYYLCHTQRSINLMNIIFNDFLAIPICKKPLNAYLIREIIHWVSKSPQSKIKHNYLFKTAAKSFKISYDMNLVYQQIIRNKQQSIQCQTKQLSQIADPPQTPMVPVQSDEDGDLELQTQTTPESSINLSQTDVLMIESYALCIFFYFFF